MKEYEMEELIEAQRNAPESEITPEVKKLLLGNSTESGLTRLFGSPFRF